MTNEFFLGALNILRSGQKCAKCGIKESEAWFMDWYLCHTQDGPIYFDEVCFQNNRMPVAFSCCGGKGTATWDANNNHWKCTDCGTPQSNDPSYIGGGLIPAKTPNDSFWTKKCECGADTVYGPNSGMHSATMPCPLYKKP